jgi:hypothetical protein
MKYAVEMGSGATIQVPSFIKIGSAIQKLGVGIHIQTHTNLTVCSMATFSVSAVEKPPITGVIVARW